MTANSREWFRWTEGQPVVGVDPDNPEPGGPEWDAHTDHGDELAASDAPETRRTPLLRPLGMTDAESWDFDMERD